MTPIPKFADNIEPHHERFSLDGREDVYVIGDVHGSRRALDVLLEKLALGPNDLVIFVGDLVRKGPDSPGVIDRVREDARLVSVRGNNEQKIIRGDESPDWLREDDQEFFKSLPVAISFDEALVVHGGIDPRRPLADHTVEELLTMRAPTGDGYDGPFWYEEYNGPNRVFFGHTVHDRPIKREYAVALDTGCVYGGPLTAYDYRQDGFRTVDPPTAHQNRSCSKIVTLL